MFWSDGIYNILEVNPEELGTNVEGFYSYIHPDDSDDVEEMIKHILKKGELDLEYRIITSNNKQKYLHGRVLVIKDSNEIPIKVIGIIQDVTEQKKIEGDLRDLGNDLITVQKIAGIGSWKYDVLNDEFIGAEEIYELYNIDYIESKLDFEGAIKFVHPDDRTRVRESMNSLLNGKSYGLEYRVIQKDGSEKYIIGRGGPVLDINSKVTGIIGTMQDVTENRLLWKQVNSIQGKFENLIRESNDIFAIIDQDGVVKYMSEASQRITGVKPEKRIGESLFKLYNEEEVEKLSQMIDLVKEVPNKKVQGQVAVRNVKNKELYLEVNMQNLLHNPDINGIVLNFRDISKRIEMERQIAYISTHDGLTGLPNTIYCSKKLRLQCEHARKNKTRFAFLMLDISGLKDIKYMLGYEMKDQVIMKIVGRLKTYLGEGTFVSRHSEDHFGIIIQGLKRIDDYEKIAQGIIHSLSMPYKIDSYELDISLNIGICFYPGNSDDMESLRNRSKVALLRAKKEGKNTYKFYSSDLDILSYKEFVLRSDLHNAIKKKQLTLYYQPIVNLNTNEILGAEALIRWNHPEWGMVRPNEFIYLAEETGLIIDIGKWVINEVCRTYKKWMDAGMKKIKISVNISPVQMLEKHFVRNILEIASRNGLEPSFLILEITEGGLLGNTNKVKSDISEIRSHGIMVAIDDFGTGFSSLAYLNAFNLDILKIDQSFIKNVPKDNPCATITRTIVNLSEELGIKIVAEGIENWDQLKYLKDINCHTGQGYLYNEPIQVSDFEEVLKQGKCRPTLTDGPSRIPYEERRNFFRINFVQLLESSLSILSFKGRKIDVGGTKVLIKDIGPGGLCFISNIRFPVERDIVLQFSILLMEKEFTLYGNLVWTRELERNLYEYGVEFTIDENERMDLIRELNQVQIKMRKNTTFVEGNFISGTYLQYFPSV